jgi:hypothetical protein
MFLSLDFLYVPSKPPDPVVAYYTEVLGGTLLFRIKEMGTQVAGIQLSKTGPLVLLAEHLEGSLPILIYRVENLDRTMREMERRGWKRGERFQIPQGPCCTFTAEGSQRLAIYELTRPDVIEHFMDRFDP